MILGDDPCMMYSMAEHEQGDNPDNPSQSIEQRAAANGEGNSHLLIAVGKRDRRVNYDSVDCTTGILSSQDLNPCTDESRGLYKQNNVDDGDFYVGSYTKNNGVNSMLDHWASKPGKYTLRGILTVGDYSSSNLVHTSIKLLSEKKRQTRSLIIHQGSPIKVSGLSSWFRECAGSVSVLYFLSSRDEGRGVMKYGQIKAGQVMRLTEGEFPMDSSVTLCIETGWGQWIQLFHQNIQRLLDTGHDMYIRSAHTRHGTRGLAYITAQPEILADRCLVFKPRPEQQRHVIKVLQWRGRMDERMTGKCRIKS